MGLAVEEVDVVEDMIRRGLLIGLNTSDKVRRSWLRRFLDTAFASAQFINRSYWSLSFFSHPCMSGSSWFDGPD